MTYDPSTTTAIVQDMAERIRALERQVNAPGPFGVIQAKGDLIVGLGPGNPTRFPVAPDGQTIVGDHTTATGWNYASLGGSSGGWWDAIIDPNLSASDPANHLFVTLFEALPHYASQGQATFIFRDSNFTGINETMDAATAPSVVTIIGTPAAGIEDLIGWNLHGHKAHVNQWRISGLEISGGSDPVFSYPADLYLLLDKCRLLTGANQLVPATQFNEVDAMRCLFQGINIPCSRVFLEDCDAICDSASRIGNVESIGGTTTSLVVMSNVTLEGPSLAVNALHGFFYGLTGSRVNRNSVGTASPTTVTFPAGFGGLVTAGGESQDSRGTAVAGIAISALGSLSDLALYGHFESVQIGQPTANGLHGDFSVSESFDIMGPCNARITKLDGIQGAAGTLRGVGNNLDLITAAGDTSTYTTLTCAGVTDSNIRVSSRRTALSGTQTPYSFDAASGRNFLDFAGASTYPGPGVDAGQANVVRTESYSYGMPITGQAGTTYTLKLSDGGTRIRFAQACTVTVPAGLPVGWQTELYQAGAGQVTVASGTGMSEESDGTKVKTAAQGASIGVAIDTLSIYVLSGDLA